MEVTIRHIKPENLDDMSDARMCIVVEGKEYVMAKLKIGDIADVTAAVRSEDLSMFVEGARTLRLADGERGKAMAEIIRGDYPLTKVIDHANGRLRLLHASLKRAGSKMTWEQVRNDIPVDILSELVRVLLWCSGFGDPEGEDNGNPTTTTGETESSNATGQ